MKSKRFSIEQIESAIKQHEARLFIAEIARRMRSCQYCISAARR